MILATVHAHPRDERIQFFEEGHYYVVDGKRVNASVSKVVEFYFPQFDAQGTVDKLFKCWKVDKRSKYYQLINYFSLVLHIDDEEQQKNEIINLWKLNGADKARYGTSLHYAIEMYLNEQPVPEPIPPEFQLFLEWRKKHPTWIPYRTEWSVFHEEFQVAGQIDSLWFDQSTGQFIMVDWKCVQKMETESSYKEKGFIPFENFPNTNLWHYVIQQNLYRFFLESKYGIKVHTCYLVQLHQKLKEAVEWPLDDIQSDMFTALTNFRLEYPVDPDPDPEIEIETEAESDLEAQNEEASEIEVGEASDAGEPNAKRCKQTDVLSELLTIQPFCYDVDCGACETE
jgi:hypothetical protein